MGFPSQVNVQPAIGVAGDFANANPRFTVPAGAGTFVAGAAGLLIGAFAWADPVVPNRLNSFGPGSVTGFVGRFGQRADIIQYLQDSSMVILPGMDATVYNGGDFLMKNGGASAVTIGMKAYANNSTGLVTFGPTGTPPTSASATSATLAKIVSASTGGALPVANTCTGSIAGNVLTVSAVGTGSVLAGGVGQTIAGTGIDPNTSIISQLSGAAGGAGTYQVSVSQNVGSEAITLSGGGLTLTGGNTSGVFAPGMTISGTNIPTGTTILAYGTGTAGGAGTYLVDRPAATAATASTVTAANAMFLTVDASSTGTWSLNDLLTGSGVAANQSIAATGLTNPNLTGIGGAGTYLTNQFQSSALTAQTIGVNAGVETKWFAMSNGAAGDTIVTSDHALG